MKVIEIDQWSQTGNVSDFTFEKLEKLIESCGPNEVPKLEGGDAGASIAMGIASFKVKEVDEDDKPRLGYVWYIEDEDGSPKRWKTNYATR